MQADRQTNILIEVPLAPPSQGRSNNPVNISLYALGDIRLDESRFGFGECIRDTRVYTFTKLHDRRIPTMYPNPDF